MASPPKHGPHEHIYPPLSSAVPRKDNTLSADAGALAGIVRSITIGVNVNRHSQFVSAIKRAIPDPSPAVAAYIDQYQANLPIFNNPNASDEDRDHALDASTTRFYQCTKSEQQQLISIQKGL